MQIVSMSKYLTASNLLTVARIGLIPFIVFYLYHASWPLATGLFIVAVVTDFLDGFIARLTNTQTEVGRLLDPVADKLLVLGVVGVLVFGRNPLLQGQEWLFWILFFKELCLVVGAFVLWTQGKSYAIKPRMIGKVAMAVQALLLIVILCAAWKSSLSHFAIAFLSGVVASINLFALLFYIVNAFKN